MHSDELCHYVPIFIVNYVVLWYNNFIRIFDNESGDYVSFTEDINTIEKLKAWLEELENIMNSPDFYLPADKYKPQIEDLREQINQMSKSINETKPITYKKVSFEECFDIYLNYIEDHKTTNIEYDYCTLDGVRLGEWVRVILNQKITSGSLEDCYVEKLNISPYEKTIKPLYWCEWFDIAVSLITPERYNYIPNIKYNKIYKVGGWLKRQIANLNDLDQEKLDKILLSFDWLIHPVKIKKKWSIANNTATPTPTKKISSNKSVTPKPTKKLSPNKFIMPKPVGKLSPKELWEYRWIKQINIINKIAYQDDNRLDSTYSAWIQRRIMDCLYKFYRKPSQKQTDELYLLIVDLLVDDKIDFVGNNRLSVNDVINLYKRMVDLKEKDYTKKKLLISILDSKYVNKLIPLTDIVSEYRSESSDKTICESSLLSVIQSYVNTWDNNELSVRQNKDIFESKLCNYPDMSDYLW